MLSLSSIITQLDQNRSTFESLLNGVPQDQVIWKPAAEKWCLLEVVCHLYDEEREDFRARVKQVLETPDQPLPSINPVGWVIERKYIERNFEKMAGKFIEERVASINWLRSLQSPSWDNACQHPKFGSMPARMFLHSWLAHDYFHFRQITRLKYGFLLAKGDQPLDYAGSW